MTDYCPVIESAAMLGWLGCNMGGEMYGECLDPHAGLKIYTSSSYDLCYPC